MDDLRKTITGAKDRELWSCVADLSGVMKRKPNKRNGAEWIIYRFYKVLQKEIDNRLNANFEK